jgi:molybdenum cofactor synthesis domain-containing protein
MRTAVITVSTSRARGEAEDTGGPALAAYAERLGAEVVGKDVIADDRELIAERLRFWCDEGGCSLVLTTGGTGFATDDVTPEATRDVIDREAPGLPEAMRAASREHTAMWMTSRGVAGTRGRSLIVNFPGNPPAIEQAGAALEQAIPHAVSLLAGGRGHPHR